MIGPAGSPLYKFIVTDEAIRQSLDLVLPEPCRGRPWAAFHCWMATGEDRIEETFGVISLIHRDRTTVRLESPSVRTRDERGETVGAGALVRPEGMSSG